MSFNIKEKGPRDLNLREWCILMEEFKKWPFRPDVLFLVFIARVLR
jgi:hypothetical protein